MSAHVLVVDDEAAIRDMLRMALEASGFDVSEANSAHQAQSRLRDSKPDVMLLDWMMPGVSGLDFARKLRREDEFSKLGIIMLTAKTDEEHCINGLEVGADDYVTKPFSPRELVARIHAVLRRIKQPSGQETLSAGNIRVDTTTHRITVGDAILDLSPTEFRLLHFFVSHPERVYTRGQLLDQVWGQNVFVEERTVDVHIRRLRKVLQPQGCDGYIQTVRSVGYRFSTVVDGVNS